MFRSETFYGTAHDADQRLRERIAEVTAVPDDGTGELPDSDQAVETVGTLLDVWFPSLETG